MVIVRSWLSEFIDISEISDEQIVDALNKIGFEVEGVTKYAPPENVVIGYIREREPHPNAEKLSVCKVDIGANEPLQIVCGAPNARAGLTVAVATNGAVMPNGLKIAPTVLRGIDSFGMICSSTELNYPKTNDGIWELDSSIGEFSIGAKLTDLKCFYETVIEIDVTPNRGDALSILGVAREIAAYFNLKIKKPICKYSDEHEPGIGRVLNVQYSAKSSVVSLFGVAKLNEALDGTCKQAVVDFRLALCDIKPKNDFEKLALYTTHATGVLLNAYSAADLAHKDDKLELFIVTNSDGVDVASGANELATVAVEQTEYPKFSQEQVVIQVSYVKPEVVVNIKKQTKALYLAKRGSEPELFTGLNYVFNKMHEFCGYTFYSGVLEFGQLEEPKTIKMDVGLVEKIIGQELDKNKVVNLLTRLGFKVTTNIEFDNCLVEVPLYRHDISNVYDLAEEVLRLKGLEEIEPKPLSLVNPKADLVALKELSFRRKLRHKSASAGFYETVHFIFTQKSLLKKLGFKTIDENLEILNPITAELDTLRTSLIPNLLNSAKNNANNSKKLIPLFETGVVFDESRNESNKITYLFSGDSERDSVLNSGKPASVSLPQFMAKIASCIGRFELEPATPQTGLWHPYIFNNVILNGKCVGVIGKIHPLISEDFALSDTYACELDLDMLKRDDLKAKEFSRFQSVTRDLTLNWSKDVAFISAKNSIAALKIEDLKNFYAIDYYSKDKDSKTVNLTVRAMFQSNDKTLEEEDIVKYMALVKDALEAISGV